jgi:hypothetical protein
MGGRKQSRWCEIADGFAVCGFSATLAGYFEIASEDGLTTAGARARMPEYAWIILQLRGSRIAGLFLLRGNQLWISKIKFGISAIAASTRPITNYCCPVQTTA